MSVWTEGGIEVRSPELIERSEHHKKGPRTYGERPLRTKRERKLIVYEEFMRLPASRWVPWILALRAVAQ